MRLQSVGLFNGYDQSIIWSTNQQIGFVEFYFADSELAAATVLNQSLMFGVVRRVFNERIPLSFDDPWPRAVHQASTVHWGHI